jgi:hypothetical protein
MQRAMRFLFAFVAASAIAACSSSSSTSGSTPGTPPGPPVAPPPVSLAAPPPPPESDAGADSGLTGQCASTFGASLTEGFGRIDGIVYAVQKPSDTQCTMPNSDHVVLQVLMGGAVYRMVVNVQGSGADTRLWLLKVQHALPAPAYAEGWHADAQLDYVTTLSVHTTDAFTPYEMDPLVTEVAGELHVGDPISVYATVGAGRPESAHLVHRNATNQDGAIVLAPSSATPSLLLFHFADQTF